MQPGGARLRKGTKLKTRISIFQDGWLVLSSTCAVIHKGLTFSKGYDDEFNIQF